MQSGEVLMTRVKLSSHESFEKPCALWQGYIMPNGYGLLYMDGVRDYAHRQSHRFFVGPIPEGLEIDHLCRNRACIEPTHLEAVTRRVNQKRGVRGSKIACINGHPYTPANTRIRTNGTRTCRACCRERKARAYAAHEKGAV